MLTLANPLNSKVDRSTRDDHTRQMSKSTTPSLRNHFLLAMPQLADPRFAHTVTYLCEHNENGAMGIVINRPLSVTIGDIFKQLQIDVSPNPLNNNDLVFAGGPVQTERGFVIHPAEGQWESTIKMENNINITTSKDILHAIAHNAGPTEFLIALGYAGWSAGQLESELAANAWIYSPADTQILFRTPHDKRLEAAAGLLGVDINLLSSDVGHA